MLSNGHGQRWVCGAHTLTNDRLGDASRSTDEVGVDEHDCEHMASRDGCERGQQPRQVGSGERLSQGRPGEDSGGQGNEQRTLP